MKKEETKKDMEESQYTFQYPYCEIFVFLWLMQISCDFSYCSYCGKQVYSSLEKINEVNKEIGEIYYENFRIYSKWKVISVWGR